MKLKVLKEFKDLKEDILRQPGDIFDCSKERYEEIQKGLSKHCGQCKWIEEVKEPKKDKKK